MIRVNKNIKTTPYKRKKAIVIATHPDDETLGAGGVLLKHKAEGDFIYWVIVTTKNRRDAKIEEQEIATVTGLYNFDGVFNLKFPTKKLDQIPKVEIIDEISRIFKKVQPEIIYLPFKGDVHSDHRLVFESAFSCTKSFRYPFIKKVLMMEVISETDFAPGINGYAFTPNYFVDISEFFERKLEIMKVYKSELADHPFPRSLENIKALATFRGAMAGCMYGESFVMLKEVWQ